MRVLGIDPGVAQTGWAVLEDSTGSGGLLVASGLLRTYPRQSLSRRLRTLHSAAKSLLEQYRPQMVAIEELFFMKAARSVAATSYARAVILLAAAEYSCPVAEYNPRSVKTALTGNGNAPKPQMQRMVQALLSLEEPPRPDDVADAMAIGLCHLRYARFQNRVASSEWRVRGLSDSNKTRASPTHNSKP